MRKILTILLVLMLAISGVACVDNGESSSSNGVNDSEETFVIIAAHSHNEILSVHHFFVYFIEEIEKLSHGRISVTLFPAGQLGGDPDLTTKIQAGEIQMMGSNISPHSIFMPDLAVFDIQFVHPNLEIARKVISDQELLEKVAEIYAEDGFHHLGFTDSAFGHISANFPIMSPADMKGLPIRSRINSFHVAAWEAIGADPVSLSIGQIFTSLQEGVIVAQENPLEQSILFGFYQLQTHFTESNHFLHVNTYVMCKEFYNSLPEDLQSAVDQAAMTAILRTQAHHDANMQGQIGYLIYQGIEFVPLTSGQRAAFTNAVRPSWELVENAVSEEMFRIFFEAVRRSQN